MIIDINTNESRDFLLSLNLFNYKDKKKYIKTLYTISNSIKKNTKVSKIKKKNGKLRTIYKPNHLLKEIQKNILNNILYKENVSNYAKAYIKGLSLKDNALPHLNKKVILKLDIKDFFENICFIDIFDSCFNRDYIPKKVGMLLTYLCTYDDHLAQGYPTSAYISNLVMKEFDEIIGKFSALNNISYTRYSDDITFSGDFLPSDIIKIVRKQLHKLDLELNNEKIHVIYNYNSQNVTGITVNEKIQVNSKYRKKIRQEIYYIKKYSLESHLKRNNIDSINKYLNNLYGRILYVLQINNNDQEFQEYKEFINKIKRQYS